MKTNKQMVFHDCNAGYEIPEVNNKIQICLRISIGSPSTIPVRKMKQEQNLKKHRDRQVNIYFAKLNTGEIQISTSLQTRTQTDKHFTIMT